MNLVIPRWADVLMEIYKAKEFNRYCQKLNRKVKISMTHLRSIVFLLEQQKLVKITPTKKIKKICLTEKGESIAISWMVIKNILRGPS